MNLRFVTNSPFFRLSTDHVYALYIHAWDESQRVRRTKSRSTIFSDGETETRIAGLVMSKNAISLSIRPKRTTVSSGTIPSSSTCASNVHQMMRASKKMIPQLFRISLIWNQRREREPPAPGPSLCSLYMFFSFRQISSNVRTLHRCVVTYHSTRGCTSDTDFSTTRSYHHHITTRDLISLVNDCH